MKLVIIEWDDACGSERWESRDDVTHITPCVTSGILLREDDKELELTLCINPMTKLGSLTIPKGCIRRVRRLHI